MSIQLQYNLSIKMGKIKENLIDISASSTLAINELSKSLENEGNEIFKFGLGQSPFPIPIVIVEELKKNAYQKDYLNVSGLLGLRESVAKYHSKLNNNKFSSEDVLIGPGSKELIFQTQLVIDGELILPSPSWVSFEPQAKILNKKVHWIKTNSKQNWHVTPDKLNEVCKSGEWKVDFGDVVLFALVVVEQLC